VKFLQRFVANGVAVYLALYLVDSVADGRFRVGAIWVAVLFALVVSFVNSLIRPLHRIRARTPRSLIVTALTLIANGLMVQVFAWATPLSVANLSWVLLIAAFVSVLTGAINWLIGFVAPVKGRPAERNTRVKAPRTPGAARGNRAPRPRSPRW
jgi:uncharacterized membrane protein YvlD (DUF360 family)